MRFSTMSPLFVVLMSICCILLSRVDVAAASAPATAGGRSVMPWMCLERCNNSETDIHEHLLQLLEHRADVDAVAFELFNLGPGSTLVTNKLAQVETTLRQLGFETFAMISSYPYPPQFLDWMRQLFRQPSDFIDSCLHEAHSRQLTGFNVDFEPTATATAQDALDYAAFLHKFAAALHGVGRKLTVDIASWNSIWDWTALSKTSVDTFNLMSTYTGNFTIFQADLSRAVSTFGVDKLGVGLENINPNAKEPFTMAEMIERFADITAHNATQIDIWDMPVPENWWPLIQKWRAGS